MLEAGRGRCFAAVVMASLLAGCAAPSLSPAAAPPDVVPTPSGPSFAEAVEVDPTRRGFEPGLAVAPDGTLYLCSIRAFGRGSDLWRSTDGGASFTYLGTSAHDAAPVLRSGTGDLGGGDCDVAVDEGGRVYVVDSWLGGVSVAASADRGATWEGTPLSLLAPPVDRPWVVAGRAGEVWVAGNQVGPGAASGIKVARSTDGGRTFPEQAQVVGNEGRAGLHSNLARGDGRLYLAYQVAHGSNDIELVVARSDDDGRTWRPHPVARQEVGDDACGGLVVFPVVEADAAGGVYLTWALQSAETGRVDLYFASSPDHGERWNPPLLLSDSPGTRAFPWMAVKAPGEVGIVWYETDAGALLQVANPATCAWEGADDADWFVRFASIREGASPSPIVAGSLVSPEVAHHGPLERPYAERIDIEYHPDGSAMPAYVADTPSAAARLFIAVQAGETGAVGRTPGPHGLGSSGSRTSRVQ